MDLSQLAPRSDKTNTSNSRTSSSPHRATSFQYENCFTQQFSHGPKKEFNNATTNLSTLASQWLRTYNTNPIWYLLEGNLDSSITCSLHSAMQHLRFFTCNFVHDSTGWNSYWDSSTGSMGLKRDKWHEPLSQRWICPCTASLYACQAINANYKLITRLC
jgi:hypothetical protein